MLLLYLPRQWTSRAIRRGADPETEGPMRRKTTSAVLLAGASALGAAIGAGPAAAHPHVWVNVSTTVNYDKGSVTGLSHTWAFDDMYTAMAVQGLDANSDGTYTREELAELAKVNIDSMKEFKYFTVAKLGGRGLEFKDPTDYWLEHKDGILSLHFTMPFEQPVLADAEGLSFVVVDETFFISFDLIEKDPVKLAGAPDGCAASIVMPKEDIDQLQALNDAFGGQLTAGNANQGMGAGYAKTVTLGCKKS
jgi:ABC-type uncharacterized transport system substrate-binding protein